jgi:hypothetical protein
MEELENQKKFDQFTDFCDTFHLKRGKTSEVEEKEIVGEFKVFEYPKLNDVYIECFMFRVCLKCMQLKIINWIFKNL